MLKITYKIDYVGNWGSSCFSSCKPKELKYMFMVIMKTVIDLSGMGYIKYTDGDELLNCINKISCYQLKKL